MRQLFLLLVSIIFAFGITACESRKVSLQENGTESAQLGNKANGITKPASYKIGLNLELSGASSVWGVPQSQAIHMAVEEINQKGGINGVPIELITYDNRSNETQSLIIAKRLVEQDQVLAIIGGGTTPTTMSFVPYAQQKKVPVISVGSGDTISSPVEKRKWVFKTPSNNRDLAEAIIDFLVAQKKTKIAFMSVNNAYGDSGKKEFEKVAKGRGIKIVAYETFGATDTDMKPQLINVKSKNPQAIVVWAIPPAASIVNKNYWELKMDNTLIYSAGAGSNLFIDLIGKEAALGTYMASGKVWVADQLDDKDEQKELVTNYVKNFAAKTKNQASPIDGMAYDAMLLLAKAIEQVGDHVTRETIRNELEKIHHLVGITGIFNLSPQDHQGLSKKDVVIIQVRENGWSLVDKGANK